ncbi:MULTISPECIES: potassium channel family protein [Streptomyces]|uniref:potassium channel family protein n=1 Tax=Streptomyces TaxID=1883 RepID=UPI001CEDA41A|nr:MULTISPECIES: potassium channel family protein [Streptomyces]MDI5909033.1 potassium channel family protein [Streptomyces sp. 12257]
MGSTPRRSRRESRRAVVRSLLSAALLVTVYYLLPLDSAFTPGTVLGLAGGIVAVGLLLSWQIRKISLSQRPELRAMEALGTTLPLYLLLFATTYYLMEQSAPDSFSEPLTRSDALYFTVTVFSTVGFGDISPRSEPARLLATGQMTMNLLLIGVAARLLVSAVEQGRTHQDATAVEGQNGGTPKAP